MAQPHEHSIRVLDVANEFDAAAELVHHAGDLLAPYNEYKRGDSYGLDWDEIDRRRQAVRKWLDQFDSIFDSCWESFKVDQAKQAANAKDGGE